MFNINILMLHGASISKSNMATKIKTKSYHIIKVLNATKVDEKAMNSNRYNRIPQPFLDNILKKDS